MVNINKLKGKFVEFELTQADVANSLNVTTKTLQNKLKSGNFSANEIDKLICLLHLDVEDATKIFFAQLST